MSPLDQLRSFAAGGETFSREDAQSLLEFLDSREVIVQVPLGEGGVKAALGGLELEEDEPLPKNDKVVALEDYRIRSENDLGSDVVCVVEFIWSRTKFGWNVFVRDLEDMRRGKGDGHLRPPETHHEVTLAVLHIRAGANDLARHFGLDYLIKEEDDV